MSKMSTFSGFSEEDLERMKLDQHEINSDTPHSVVSQNDVKKVAKIGSKPKRVINKYKLPTLQTQNSDDVIDSIEFSKCKLSIKTPVETAYIINNNDGETKSAACDNNFDNKTESNGFTESNKSLEYSSENMMDSRKSSIVVTPDIVRGVDNYTEDELEAHRVKLHELQLKQKLMEEQNKKRKEMLAKALADRTRQTEEEVLRLEKIKKELQVLDGQFSQDVAVLRKKIDQACLSYSEAEKHYLRIEKEFLQAKISLQKEKEKKELLTEHLCALITHNETRKAQKLETLMLELASDKRSSISELESPVEDQCPIIEDGVDQRTGKMVEITNEC